MNLLEQMPEDSIDNLRWCFYAPDESNDANLARVPERVLKLVVAKRGRLVPIPGFDEIMLLLQWQMSPVMKMPDLRERMQERAQQRYDLYAKQESELNERVSGKAKGSHTASATHPASDVNQLLKHAMMELAAANKVKPWWQWANEVAAAASIDEKDKIYQQGILALPASADLLGDYAVFLKNERKDMDKAEELFKRAIKTNPNHANNLGNYAVFLKNECREMGKAEEFYKRAIEADPKHANTLGNYANFIKTELKDLDKAEEFYKRAIEADPNHANTLGNYAIFLHNERKDMDKAEEFYKRAIEAEPKNANILGNYAVFLQKERNDLNKAEEFYKRAIEADPMHVNTLGNYANFLQNKRNDIEKAEEFYKRAIEADAKHASTLGNYAQFCFLLNRHDDGIRVLRLADLLNPTADDLRVELVFYHLAHDSEAWPAGLAQMANLLASGARSLGWDLDANVSRARNSGHPNPELLAAIADVISKGAPLESLDRFPEWLARGKANE